MTNTTKKRNWISIISLGAASTTLMFAVALGMTASPTAQAQTLTTLYNFTDGADGGYPYAQPVVDKDGNMFGTAEEGGDSSCGPWGCGTVWELSSAGTFTVLHTFEGSDGAYPGAGVKLDNKGNMFGTASDSGPYHFGTVFSIKADGTFTTLYDFGSWYGSPAWPECGVTLDSSDNLYGTSYEGGSNGIGTVWKLSLSSPVSVLHDFTGGADGAYPNNGSLHRDKKGSLFGVAEFGGMGGRDGCGTLFEIKPDGTFKVLYSFACGNDGGHPMGTIREYEGKLYGTANSYGAGGHGTVWQYNLGAGRLKVLHSFSYSDGGYPLGGVACQRGKKTVCAGNLFGTTYYGGTAGYGTVWEIDSKGTFRTLHNFSGPDGESPYARPFVDRMGNIYGTTWRGGTSNAGTVWKIAFP
jgi:uncharacterized repeat protein (TIGR03803 family)